MPRKRSELQDPESPPHGIGRWVWLLPGLTLLMQSTVFLGMNWPRANPVDWWVLSFVCLVPWVLAVAWAPHDRRIGLLSYGLGVVFYLINTYYIWAITIPGYIALGLSFGLFYWLFAVALRRSYFKWRLPFTLAVPVLWVASEYARGVGPLAFPFLFLAHGVYRRLPLIQISDVAGAYGVSFVIAMVNGLIVDCILRQWPGHRADGGRHKVAGPVLATLLVVSGTLLYGVMRLRGNTLSDGPLIAVLQADYPLSVDPLQPRVREFEKAKTYFELMLQATASQPDPPELFLLPETPWAMSLNEEFLSAEKFPVNAAYYEEFQRRSRQYDELFHKFADRQGAHVVVGAGALEFPPTPHYPSTLKFNSAYVYSPGSEVKGRYNKVVLVMFGEYTPFRYGRLHFLYRWLDSFNPFSLPDDEFSLTPGSEYSVFRMRDSADRQYCFGVPICFEDLIPKVSRHFAVGGGGRQRVDYLLSISNDGWFNHGSIVPQHLAVCVFRAVENRVGIARSVNTACSGFVDPDGRIHDVVNADGRMLGPNLFGYQVARVKIDSRRSLYSRIGDLFGFVCALVGALLLLVLWAQALYRRLFRVAQA